jgi:hypothetical protein
MQKTALALLLLLPALASAQLPGKNFKLKPEMLSFQYSSYGQKRQGPGPRPPAAAANCTHVIEDDLSQDWTVECVTVEGARKLFRVHLWLKGYFRPQQPQATYELLYWVTDRTRGQTTATGTSLWFHFRETASLQSLTAGQSVDDDTAGLYLDVRLP